MQIYFFQLFKAAFGNAGLVGCKIFSPDVSELELILQSDLYAVIIHNLEL